MGDNDLKFKHPFSCTVSGPSKSGKKSFCIRLLQKLDSLCTESDFVGGIIWCYSEKTAVPKSECCPQIPHITRAYRRTFVVVVVENRGS